MRRGTRVGQAYVAMSVDGDGINEEIVDALEDVDFDKATRNQRGRFNKNFTKELRSAIEDSLKSMGKSLDDTFKGLEQAGRNYDAITQGARKRLKETFASGDADVLFDQVGERLGIRMGDSMRRTMIESIQRSLDNLASDAARRGKGIELFSEQGGIDLPLPDFDRVVREAEKSVQAQRKALNELSEFTAKVEQARVDMREKSNASILKDDQNLLREQEKLFKQLQREYAREERARLRALAPGNRRGDRIGRGFGAGVRNDAFNLLGRSLGGIINLIDKSQRGATALFDTFSKGAAEAGAAGAGFFGRMAGGARAVGAAMAAAFNPGTIVVVTAALSILISVVGALLGVVTALASTIASALVGALAVAGPLMFSLAAAGGLLTAAFMSMTDAQKALLKDAFEPLRAQMVGIGQIILGEMIPAFQTWSTNLQQAVMLLAPLAQVMGQAFAQAGTIITQSLSGPGFQAFANMLRTELPTIVVNLSQAFGRFFNGLLGMFSVIMPYVTQFSQYLSDLALRFSNWANSVNGQNAIADFVARAVVSLKSLWNFVREFSGFLRDVLFSPEAQAAGVTIFDALARKFAQFRDAVREAAANGDLRRWFEDAIEFGGALWAVIEALGATFIALYNSGVVHAISMGLADFAAIVKFINGILEPLVDLIGYSLPAAFSSLLGPISPVINALGQLGGMLDWVSNKIKNVPFIRDGLAALGVLNGGTGSTRGATGRFDSEFSRILESVRGSMSGFSGRIPSLGSLIGSGRRALSGTSGSGGDDEWENPYADWAESLISQGPSIAAQIRDAVIKVNRQIATAVAEAAQSTNSETVAGSLQSLLESIRSSGENSVNAAQQALNNAAQTLASATDKKAAKKALRNVRDAQDDLEDALENQRRIEQAANILARQQILSEDRIRKLQSGRGAPNATLADYAKARLRVSEQLERANQRLTEAIQLRDNFRQQVSDSIKSFGSLLTAQAQTLNGVEQALTATDITTNLQDRLAKIKTFQDNLRILLARGLSDAAYKQLVEAGVEEGSQFAEALVQGGQGAVGSVNSLVGQIDATANQLGLEASNRLYQAGVDAAQGLVDGLTSLSGQLDAAAARLGASIANSIRRTLGIQSPSKVLISDMEAVGDGAVIGLNNQQSKVEAAADRLASLIGVRSFATGGGSASEEEGVSGNSGQKFRDLIVQTPTEDPGAVAMEVLNEVTGRL